MSFSIADCAIALALAPRPTSALAHTEKRRLVRRFRRSPGPAHTLRVPLLTDRPKTAALTGERAALALDMLAHDAYP